MAHSLGHMVHILHWRTDQAMTQALESLGLTASQARLMGYLAFQPEPLCPNDLQRTFHMSHATISGLLSRLEKKGFLEQRPDPEDHRRKRIYVLPKGEQCQQLMKAEVQKIESRIVQGFTPEERLTFAALLYRAADNMGQDGPKKEENTQ